MDTDRLRRRDRVCRATAAPQFGAFNYKQAILAGHTDDSLRRQVASGVLSRPISRVYVYQGTTRGWMQDAMIGHLFLGGGSALSHSSAGHLHGLFGFVATYPIHFSVAGNIPGHRPDFIKVHRGGPTLVEEVGVIAGIPVTSPRRTLLDLGALRHSRLEDGLDNFLRTGKTSLEQLWLMLLDERLKRRRGRTRLLSLLQARTPDAHLADSGWELEVDRHLRMRGEPPVLQHPVTLNSGITIHIDLAYPEEKLGIETDGPEHLTKKAFERDRERDRELSDLDWMVLRITSAQWAADPEGFIDSILRVRRRRRSRQ